MTSSCLPLRWRGGLPRQGHGPQPVARRAEGVLKGESALPRGLVTRVVEEFNARCAWFDLLVGRNPADRITKREWEVLELMRKHLTTAQMADALFVSRATVRTHVSAIMRKLHVTDRAAAVRLIEERSTEHDEHA